MIPEQPAAIEMNSRSGGSAVGRRSEVLAQRAALHEGVALAKSNLLLERDYPWRAHLAGPAGVMMRHPVAVAAGSFALGVLMWRSPWTRNALRLAALWGLKNLVSRGVSRWF